ncbi:MAG: hypothetical protein EA406_09530 [Rhodospirillales bacterium]|nr:MAG: hypothetical protein EA406_09530 [Rhodospirillales bacterium]
MIPPPFSVDDIEDYVNGRLSLDRLDDFETALEHDRALAAAVRACRRRNAALRRLGADILVESVPERLTRVARSAASAGTSRSAFATATWQSLPSGPRTRRMAMGTLALAFVIGVTVGWAGHDAVVPPALACDPIVRDVTTGFSAAPERVRNLLPFPEGRQNELMEWLDKAVGRSVARPDLSPFGYRFVGGTLIPGYECASGVLVYHDGDGDDYLGIFIWPRTDPPPLSFSRMAMRGPAGDMQIGQSDGLFVGVVTNAGRRLAEATAVGLFSVFDAVPVPAR